MSIVKAVLRCGIGHISVHTAKTKWQHAAPLNVVSANQISPCPQCVIGAFTPVPAVHSDTHTLMACVNRSYIISMLKMISFTKLHSYLSQTHALLLVFIVGTLLCRVLCLTHTDTFSFCTDNSDRGAILVCHHLCKPKQIVKKKRVCAYNDTNHSPEKLYENLIAGPVKQRQRERNRMIKELWPSTLFLLAYLLHQPGSAKEIQFIIIDHTQHQLCTGTLKQLHTYNEQNKLPPTDVWSICNWKNWNIKALAKNSLHISLVTRFWYITSPENWQGKQRLYSNSNPHSTVCRSDGIQGFIAINAIYCSCSNYS